MAQDVYSRTGCDVDPPFLCPAYRSTALRAPMRPPVVIPQTLSEITGPVCTATPTWCPGRPI